MNIKNITCREKIAVNDLIEGNHYYITKKSNYLRIRIIKNDTQNRIIELEVLTPGPSPLSGAICKLDISNTECEFYAILHKDMKGKKPTIT
ncbi:MAG: hypothetical protein FWG77_03890 [Treponema sp.]|nr:hypothetical protein [Treponema sp.]